MHAWVGKRRKKISIFIDVETKPFFLSFGLKDQACSKTEFEGASLIIHVHNKGGHHCLSISKSYDVVRKVMVERWFPIVRNILTPFCKRVSIHR